MRVRSQDGAIDVPNGQVILQRIKEAIYFRSTSLDDKGWAATDQRPAEYSTEDKGQAAKDMMLSDYGDEEYFFQFPDEEDVVENGKGGIKKKKITKRQENGGDIYAGRCNDTGGK